jgi:dTDP-4-amino-4,6-dideoxygalactose transaminase
MKPIPLVDLKAQYEPIKEEIHHAWDQIFSSMYLFLGPNVQAFEKEFSEYCDTKYAIGVSDGTTAIHLALRAIGIRLGDEVITVSHTFIATAEAVILAGATPVFVDIDPHTYTIDVDQVEKAITSRTKAIIPVHLYGQCAEMDPILEIAQKYKLAIIEDACQAHGATYKGRKAGSIGDMGCFSFYFSKNLGAYGEGGMVTTSNADYAQKIRMMRDHGSERRYFHEVLGWNGRLDELQAAVLRIKLPHLDSWNERRRQIASFYQSGMSDMGIETPQERAGNRHVYHLYVIRTEDRDALRNLLDQEGIGTGIHYPVPIHLQPAFKKYSPPMGSLPVTERIVTQILSLPMYPELSPDQAQRVVEGIRKAKMK